MSSTTNHGETVHDGHGGGAHNGHGGLTKEQRAAALDEFIKTELPKVPYDLSNQCNVQVVFFGLVGLVVDSACDIVYVEDNSLHDPSIYVHKDYVNPGGARVHDFYRFDLKGSYEFGGTSGSLVNEMSGMDYGKTDPVNRRRLHWLARPGDFLQDPNLNPPNHRAEFSIKGGTVRCWSLEGWKNPAIPGKPDMYCGWPGTLVRRPVARAFAVDLQVPGDFEMIQNGSTVFKLVRPNNAVIGVVNHGASTGSPNHFTAWVNWFNHFGVLGKLYRCNKISTQSLNEACPPALLSCGNNLKVTAGWSP